MGKPFSHESDCIFSNIAPGGTCLMKKKDFEPCRLNGPLHGPIHAVPAGAVARQLAYGAELRSTGAPRWAFG